MKYVNEKVKEIKKNSLNTSRKRKVAVRKTNPEKRLPKEDTADLNHKDPNIKELPDIVKQFIGEDSYE